MAAELIVGLDVSSRSEAEDRIAQLDGVADFFKIGYQLFYGGDGLTVGRELIKAGKKVFFDLKLLDIDNTVEKGVAAIAATGAHMLTVHAYPNALAAAQKAASGTGLTILGVTVLTSMDDGDLKAAGYEASVSALVEKRVLAVREAGAGGVVASAFEAKRVREIGGPEIAIVTPGIRPAGAGTEDQKRVMTPAEAAKAGATHLVVARPIVNAPDPRAAAQAIVEDIGRAG